MSLPLHSNFWTKNITNESFEVVSTMNFKAITILNNSAVAGTVAGTQTVAGIESEPLDIAQNQSMAFSSESGANVLSGLVIDAPLGCTLQLIGEL